jgi:hypothetical protein
MEHPKDVGDRWTLAIMPALRSGVTGFYVPFGENTRCDLAVEDGQRVPRRTYVGEVDLFGVYCPQTAGVYLVPIEDVPTQVAQGYG